MLPMSSKGKDEHSSSCQFIAAFVCLSSVLVFHQIEVTSTHFSVAFNIPIHNIGIYFSKLYSFRSLLMAYGSILFLCFRCLAGLSGKTSRYLSITSFFLMLVVRLTFLILVYTSRKLSYDVYMVLSSEAFVFGFLHTTLLTILPEHTVAIAFTVNLSRILVFLIQLILDRIWYNNPLHMIRLQCWISVIISCIATGLWIYYNFGVDSGCNKESEGEIGSRSSHVSPKSFIATLNEALSPFLMYYIGSLFNDFLYPGVLPYAILAREKCHTINMLMPIAKIIGPVALIALENNGLFTEWHQYYDAFWLLVIPMCTVFVYSFLAIHTRIPSARLIVNNKMLVLIETFVLVLCNGYFEPLSYTGIAKFVKPSDKSKGCGNDTIISFHIIFALLVRFIFSKLSVGYNDTRISLGYTLPRFRPKHRMSKKNLFWYIFKSTFRIAYKDTLTDFGSNIKKYL